MVHLQEVAWLPSVPADVPVTSGASQPNKVDAQSPDARQHYVLGRYFHGANNFVQPLLDSVVFSVA